MGYTCHMRLAPLVPVSPSSPGDAELLVRARAQDGAAFRALFLRHAPAVRRLLGGLFRVADDADEATQETFVRAHSALASLRDPARLRAWLLGIARIVWLDACERQRRAERFPAIHAVQAVGEQELAPSPEGDALEVEADCVLAKALARLSADRRTAVLLRLDQGLAYSEIALALDWPLHKVKNEIHRARLAIRDELQAYLAGTR